MHDVIGRLEAAYGDSDRARFLVVPALDERDESNFDYAYGVGFSTAFYREQRSIMDDASWRALYMNEPIEREGLIYGADELRRYFTLPPGEPDAISASAIPRTRARTTASCRWAMCTGRITISTTASAITVCRTPWTPVSLRFFFGTGCNLAGLNPMPQGGGSRRRFSRG